MPKKKRAQAFRGSSRYLRQLFSGWNPSIRLALALEKTLSGKSPTMKKDSWRDGSVASGTVRQAATARAESANVAENG